MLRNFIEVTGITPENELPDKINGQLIEYSEVEHIYIPNDRPKIKNVFQISIEVAVNSSRAINAPQEKLVVLDGVKKLKILYTQKYSDEKASVISFDLPYNTFFQIPKNSGDVEDVKIYIADAYFKVINDGTLYSYILYIVHVIYKKTPTSEGTSKNFLLYPNSRDAERVESLQAMDEVTISTVCSLDSLTTVDTQQALDSEYL